MTATGAARLALRLAAGLGLLALTVWLTGPRALAATLHQISPMALLPALVLAVASNAASAWRWSAIARALGLRAPLRPLLAQYARGMTSNVLLPGATVSGDVLRAWELSRLGNPLLDSTASVAFDRLSGLWTLCVLSFAAAGLAIVSGMELTLAPGAGKVLGAYGLAMGAVVALPFLPWPSAWLEGLPGAMGSRLAQLRTRLREPATAAGLRRSLGPSLLVQLLSAAALVACGRAAGLELSPLLVLAAAAPIFVMAALPVGVAGFGTRELAAVAVLGALGSAPGPALATGVLYGVLGVTQGILAAPLFLLRRRVPPGPGRA